MLRKVQHQDALQISDVVMASLLRMFQSTAGSGGVQEDALMAVSTLVEGQEWAGNSQGWGWIQEFWATWWKMSFLAGWCGEGRGAPSLEVSEAGATWDNGRRHFKVPLQPRKSWESEIQTTLEHGILGSCIFLLFPRKKCG